MIFFIGSRRQYRDQNGGSKCCNMSHILVGNVKKYYLASFSAHVSQYFSTNIAPSPTANNASLVALLPQVMQNFSLPLSSVNDFNIENTFSIYCFTPKTSLIVFTGNTAVILFAVTMNFAFLSIILCSSYDIRTYFFIGCYDEELLS